MSDSKLQIRIMGYPWVITGLLLLAVFLTLNHGLVSGTRAPIWDAGVQFEPYYTLVADFARAGKLMSWNPWMNAGSPDFIETQMGACSPVTVGMGLMTGGSVYGFVWYWLVIWFTGGLGVLFLGRHLKIPPWGAFIAALGFLFSGFYTGHAQHTSHVYTLSFLPFIIWRLDCAILSKRFKYAVQSGAFWGLSALAGYPGLVVLSGCFAGFWALGRFFCGFGDVAESASKRTGIKELRYAILSLIIILIIGSCILLPPYLGFFLEGPGFSNRAGTLSRELVCSDQAFDPASLTSFASPFVPILNLKLYFDDLHPRPNRTKCGIYTGILVWVFFIFALVSKPRDKWRWWIFGTGVFFMICSVSDSLPVRGWLYDWFLPFRYFRHSMMFRDYFIFTCTLLSMYGVKDFQEPILKAGIGISKRFCVVSLLVSLTAIGTYYSVWVRHSERYEFAEPNIHVLMWAGLILISGMVLFLRGRKKGIIVALFVVLAVLDAYQTNYISRWMMTYGGDAMRTRTLVDEKHNPNLDLIQNGLDRKELFFGETLKYSGKNHQLKVPVLSATLPMFNCFLTTTSEHKILREMAVGTERTFFCENPVTASPGHGNMAQLMNRCDKLSRPVFIITPPDTMKDVFKGDLFQTDPQEIAAIGNAPPAVNIPVTLIRYVPDELSFSVDSPQDGWILVTDRWTRGWDVEVNGVPKRVWGGNFIFRAIPVVSGVNEVSFRYAPFGHPWLIFLSWTLLFGIALYSIKKE